MKLLIATRNPGKLNEYRRLLSRLPFKIIDLRSLKAIPPDFDPPETGTTFKQNALIKAQAYGQASGLLTLADDSGLMIDHLHGQPGIHSARFAQNNFPLACQKILRLLTDVPQSQRQAKFVICLALYQPSTQTIKSFTGQVKGWISFEALGDHGFGYDPIFFSPALNQTFGQATPAQKNRLSHRAQAFKKLQAYLSQLPVDQA